MKDFKVSASDGVNYRDWFGDRKFYSVRDGCKTELTIDGLYQAFTARREAEAKEKLTKVFGPFGCRCPAPDAIRDGGTCKWFDNDESCTHPSNKPPECEAGHVESKATEICTCGWGMRPESVIRYDDIRVGPWYCPKCDKKLPWVSLPEPECKHRKKEKAFNGLGSAWILYKDLGDKHCRDCGDKL